MWQPVLPSNGLRISISKGLCRVPVLLTYKPDLDPSSLWVLDLLRNAMALYVGDVFPGEIPGWLTVTTHECFVVLHAGVIEVPTSPHGHK
jgi:hypothetical protein